MADRTGESAHPVYQHRDGSKCIWLDGTGWFVPLDAGGEGYDCRSPEHEAQRALGPERIAPTAEQTWELRVAGTDVALQRMVLDVGHDGRVTVHEALLAQLLTEGGWERVR